MFSCGERIHCGADVNFFTIAALPFIFVPEATGAPKAERSSHAERFFEV
jgi:hypothetical protein